MFILTISLATIFLSTQADELRQLPAAVASISNFHRIILKETLNSAAGVLIAGLIFLSWYGVGALIARTINALSGSDESENFSRSDVTAWGAGICSLCWMLLGWLNCYNKAAAVGALLIGAALFAFETFKAKKENDKRPPLGIIGRIAFFLIAAATLLALFAALAPPTAKDTLLYHFSLPKTYIERGGYGEVPYNIAGYLPLGAEMHSVWAMLLGRLFNERAGEAAGVIQFAFAPLLFSAVYAWAKQHVSRSWAIIAALLIASVPTIYYVAANAYVDLALALYITLAIRALSLWWTDSKAHRLISFALALGFALCVKLTAIFLLFPVVIIILFKANALQKSNALDRRALRRVILMPVLSLLAACLLASPWYLHTWLLTGSPFFPFYLNIWHGAAPGWDTERSLMFQIINSTYGGYSKGLTDYLFTPLKLSLFARPDQPLHYDGVLGITFLCALPILCFALWKNKLGGEIKIALACCAALFICWLFSSQQMRYLLPILPSLAVAIVAACEAITGKHRPASRGQLIQWLMLASTLPGLLVIFIWFAQQNPLPVVLGGETRRDYLTRRLDYYPYYEIINTQLPANARIWLINMRRDTYYLERPYFSDYMFEDYTIGEFIEQSATAKDVEEKTTQASITYILARHDVLFDYNRSPIVRETHTERENAKKMELLKSFFTEQNRIVKSDDKFILTEICGSDIR